MTMLNANAFYELAIRHMIRLPAVHMIDDRWDIPFDVAPYRAIRFSWKNIQRLEGAKQELKSVVEETLSTEFEVENPITHAWGVIEVNQHATAVERLLSDQISGLSERLDRTERAYKTLSQNVVVIPSSAGALPSATGGVIYPASITITQPSSGTITQSSSGSVTAFPEGGLLGGFGQTSETPLPMREEERRKDD